MAKWLILCIWINMCMYLYAFMFWVKTFHPRDQHMFLAYLQKAENTKRKLYLHVTSRQCKPTCQFWSQSRSLHIHVVPLTLLCSKLVGKESVLLQTWVLDSTGNTWVGWKLGKCCLHVSFQMGFKPRTSGTELWGLNNYTITTYLLWVSMM